MKKCWICKTNETEYGEACEKCRAEVMQKLKVKGGDKDA